MGAGGGGGGVRRKEKAKTVPLGLRAQADRIAMPRAGTQTSPLLASRRSVIAPLDC